MGVLILYEYMNKHVDSVGIYLILTEITNRTIVLANISTIL